MEIKALDFCVRMVMEDQYLVFSWKQKVSECISSDLRVFVWATKIVEVQLPAHLEG